MAKLSKNKIIIIAVAAVVCVAIIAGCLAVFGKNNNNGKVFDNETDSLVFSSDAVDKVFNPFFSTSGADSSVVGMTQLGMLGNDAKGNYTWGDDEEVITKDLGIMYNEAADTTTYYFVLKNNIKFSNGSALTIKDVLFNYYVYLDPAYTGSSTIYSTDIVGLKAYRTQTQDKGQQDSFGTQFQTKASARINNLLSAFNAIKKELGTATFGTLNSEQFRAKLVEYKEKHPGEANENIVNDYDKIAGYKAKNADEKDVDSLFREELSSDFTNARGTYADIKFYDKDGNEVTKDKNGKDITLKSDAEAFLYNEGYITWDKKTLTMEVKIGGTLDVIREYTDEQAINAVFDANMPGKLDQVVRYWACSATFNDYLVNAAMEDYFKQSSSKRSVPNISGIQFANRNGDVTFVSKNQDRTDGKSVTYKKAEYDANGNVTNNEVLSITINGTDPKAIWNFGIGVAPMYYYSDEKHINEFDFESHFGVEFASQSFLNDVVKSKDKIGVPVGAGAYMASKAAGGTENVKEGDFYDKGVIYYERNPYYDLGKSNFTVKNPADGKSYHVAKIKKVRYQIVTAARLVDTLTTGQIDYATPNAKTTIRDQINATKGFETKTVRTAGYGYVGINAAKVPNIYVRRAIMYSIDTSKCIDYYGSMATPIYRSMSKENWAYPENCTPYYPYIAGKIPETILDTDENGDYIYKVDEDYRDYVKKCGKKGGDTFTAKEQEDFIRGLVKKGGYTEGSDGIYAKKGNKGTEKLEYTFTVAGETTDHPAWNALDGARMLLNRWGFRIITKTDTNALSLLSSGGLTVWAAAWGSTIDPDMYQVYHKDSKATSVLNWGYKQIINGKDGIYRTEYKLVEQLSKIIEDARKTDVQEERMAFYSDALDLVMELAIELPTYQRDDLFAYNSDKIDVSTFYANPSAYKGLTSDLTQMSLRVS